MQAEPEEPKSNSGGSSGVNPKYAAKRQELLDSGIIKTQEMTGTENMQKISIDPNAAENAGIDISNVILH